MPKTRRSCRAAAAVFQGASLACAWASACAWERASLETVACVEEKRKCRAVSTARDKPNVLSGSRYAQKRATETHAKPEQKKELAYSQYQ